VPVWEQYQKSEWMKKVRTMFKRKRQCTPVLVLLLALCDGSAAAGAPIEVDTESPIIIDESVLSVNNVGLPGEFYTLRLTGSVSILEVPVDQPTPGLSEVVVDIVSQTSDVLRDCSGLPRSLAAGTRDLSFTYQCLADVRISRLDEETTQATFGTAGGDPFFRNPRLTPRGPGGETARIILDDEQSPNAFVQAIPEPGTTGLAAAGFLIAFLSRVVRRRRPAPRVSCRRSLACLAFAGLSAVGVADVSAAPIEVDADVPIIIDDSPLSIVGLPPEFARGAQVGYSVFLPDFHVPDDRPYVMQSGKTITNPATVLLSLNILGGCVVGQVTPGRSYEASNYTCNMITKNVVRNTPNFPEEPVSYTLFLPGDGAYSLRIGGPRDQPAVIVFDDQTFEGVGTGAFLGFAPAPVPEPSTFSVLSGAGLLAIAHRTVRSRRRRRG
jgi:hypothetical protein